MLKRIGKPIAAVLLGLALGVGATLGFSPGVAISQVNTILQQGGIVSGHAVRWVANRLAADAGGIAGGLSGTYLTELGVTNSGIGFCQNSGPISAAYSKACWGYDSSGNFTITVDGVGQANPGANIVVGGVSRSLTGITPSASPQPPGGRLTLATATPVMNTTVSGGTTVYWTPYGGGQVPIWTGSAWTLSSCGELTNITTNSATGSAGPLAVGATATYDLFIWSNGGTCTLTRGPLWASATTRTLALTNQNGIPVNATAITNGPGANLGTWVGTVASNASSTIDWIVGGANTAARLMVYNQWNRVGFAVAVSDTEAQYGYTSSTIRQAGGQTYNQIAFVTAGGANNQNEESANLTYAQCYALLAAAGANIKFGFGIDTVTNFSRPTSQVTSISNLGGTACLTVSSVAGSTAQTMGVHTISANEQGDNVNANNFNSTALSVLTSYMRM